MAPPTSRMPAAWYPMMMQQDARGVAARPADFGSFGSRWSQRISGSEPDYIGGEPLHTAPGAATVHVTSVFHSRNRGLDWTAAGNISGAHFVTLFIGVDGHLYSMGTGEGGVGIQLYVMPFPAKHSCFGSEWCNATA